MPPVEKFEITASIISTGMLMPVDVVSIAESTVATAPTIAAVRNFLRAVGLIPEGGFLSFIGFSFPSWNRVGTIWVD